MSRSEAVLLRWIEVRQRRDNLRAKRDGCLCERAEPMSRGDYEDAYIEQKADPTATFVFPQPTQPEPCWKAARKMDPDGRKVLIPPPSEWCKTCQQRQDLSAELRAVVDSHGGALRGLIRHAKTLRAFKAREGVNTVRGESR